MTSSFGVNEQTLNLVKGFRQTKMKLRLISRYERSLGMQKVLCQPFLRHVDTLWVVTRGVTNENLFL